MHEVAKELGVPSKELVERLKGMGVDVKSHSSSIDDSVVAQLKAPAKPHRPRPSRRRRRSRRLKHLPDEARRHLRRPNRNRKPNLNLRRSPSRSRHNPSPKSLLHRRPPRFPNRFPRSTCTAE